LLDIAEISSGVVKASRDVLWEGIRGRIDTFQHIKKLIPARGCYVRGSLLDIAEIFSGVVKASRGVLWGSLLWGSLLWGSRLTQPRSPRTVAVRRAVVDELGSWNLGIILVY
jgi:hypothetical protein